MNPILAREFRARWRDTRSFWLLFALSALLCVAVSWIYFDTADRALDGQTIYAPPMPGAYYPGSPPTPPSVNQRANDTGRTLFREMALGNVIAWLLVAPALTATGLARERERGLLESLWLTPFRIESQVLGRFIASLFYLLYLQIAALPIYGITFVLGGVSPGEIGVSALIVAMTAIMGVSLGLWCSARAYRPAGAMGVALGAIAFWTLGSLFGPAIFADTFFYLGWVWTSSLLATLAAWHPIVLLNSITTTARAMPARYGSWIPTQSMLWYCCGTQLFVTLVFLLGTIRKASKPLPEAAWFGRNPYLERWRLSLQKREEARKELLTAARSKEIDTQTERDLLEATRMSDKVGGALLWEVPFERMAHFRDPLLMREVRSRFRLRQSGIAVALGRLLALFIVVVAWLFMIASLFDPPTRGSALQALVCLIWFLGAGTIGVLGSSSLTRERESGTWEGLRLSLLIPREIVRSKWLSPLVTFAYWSSVLWIWVILSIHWIIGDATFPLMSMLEMVLVVIFSLGLVSAFSLWISSRTPIRRRLQVGLLVGILLLLLVSFGLDQVTDWRSKVGDSIYHIQDDNLRRYSSSYGYPGAMPETGDEANFRAARQLETILGGYHPLITAGVLLSPPGNSDGYDEQVGRIDNSTRALVCLMSIATSSVLTLILLGFVSKKVGAIEKF